MISDDKRKSLGQLAFEARIEFLGITGDRANWYRLGEIRKEAWEVAALVVIAAVENEKKEELVIA